MSVFFSGLIFTLLSTKLAGGHVEIQQCEYQSCSKSHKYVHPFRSIYTPRYNTVGLNTKKKKKGICTKWLYKNRCHPNTHLTFLFLKGAITAVFPSLFFICFNLSASFTFIGYKWNAASSKESARLSLAKGQTNGQYRGGKGLAIQENTEL